ncbi:MAG: hypothetical protein V4710_12925, partial [Verrucomicrobiota bacterium]
MEAFAEQPLSFTKAPVELFVDEVELSEFEKCGERRLTPLLIVGSNRVQHFPQPWHTRRVERATCQFTPDIGNCRARLNFAVSLQIEMCEHFAGKEIAAGQTRESIN